MRLNIIICRHHVVTNELPNVTLVLAEGSHVYTNAKTTPIPTPHEGMRGLANQMASLAGFMRV